MEANSFQASLLERSLISTYKVVNKYIPWHKLPTLIGAFNLLAYRIELRAQNLYDGYKERDVYGSEETEPMKDVRFEKNRNSDGEYNSLEMPLMGCAGMRFGRNVPRHYATKPSQEEMMTPHPRVVSEQFMARKPDEFKPATSLNLLAAAWIQFQTHDWFAHENGNDIKIPLPEGDPWPNSHMTIPETKPDKTLDGSDISCPGYKNMNTQWWDASQIYGSNEAQTKALRHLRPDGKLQMTENLKEQFLPRGPDGLPLTGFNNNWWIGMELLHTLFALEHNTICDKLRKVYPSWSGDQIFDKARLINSTLMAKIHTIEWTPAILAHPALVTGMNANWWGLVGEQLTKLLGRISKTSELISGIPGSGADMDGVPYSLTEEFVSVYRMHSLIPDNIAFFSAATGKHERTTRIEDVAFTKAQEPLDSGVTFADAFYSFGINYPGAITNNNYPNFLRQFTAPDGYTRDMGSLDIFRDRERGVPRYCQFRRLLHMPAPKTFIELTGGNVELASRLAEVYDNDIEKIDALVGCHSEPLPKGFGFSDTAFRIFILMASRRLKSDRFIATQWTEETYTAEGLHWIQYTTMKDVLCRHFPQLEPLLRDQKNVFAPWKQMPRSKEYKGRETNAPKKAA